MKGGWLEGNKLDGWQKKEKARWIKQEEDNKMVALERKNEGTLEGLRLWCLELIYKVPLLKIWFYNNKEKKNQMIKKKMAVAIWQLRELQVGIGG